jgi:hypothetical protein
MEISQQTIAEILQVGGQYFIPSAALLRALYSGARGKFPEGLAQIFIASIFAALTALADNQQPDLRGVLAEITGNTVFMTGLLAFIMTYLLRIPFYGFILDALVGGIIGAAAWVGWTYVLANDLPLWTLPIGVIGGMIGFVLLRLLLRQLFRLIRIATVLIVIGVLFVALAGGVYVLNGLFGAVG